MSVKRGAPAPAVVGSHFVKQYYGEVLSKKPVELHRFYKDESTFCHASGTKEEEPVSGLADIKAKIEHLGLGGATVDLGCGSVDAQPSEGDGVLLMVTGSITITDSDPRQFVQTFFLARQHQDNDRHNYFVRNDIFRFLDVLPEVVQGALRARDKDADGATARSAPAAPADAAAAPPAAEDTPDAVTPSASAVAAAAAAAVAATNEVKQQVQQQPATAVAKEEISAVTQVAPASESQAVAGGVPEHVSPSLSALDDNGSKDSGAPSPPSAGAAAAATAVPPTPPQQQQPASAPAAVTPTSSPAPSPTPAPAPAPAGPPVPMTYASLAKSWATQAAVGGEATPPGLGVTGGAPVSSASTSSPAVGHSGIASTGVGMSGMMAGGMGGGNGVRAAAAGAATTAGAGASGVGAEAGAGAGAAASNGGWGMSDVAVGGVGGGSGVGGGLGSALGESVMSGSQGHPGKGQFGGNHIPHHASPAVAASAAAAREAAAAGNGEILPATSLFVRKVDMSIDREQMITHFSKYGDVTGISMNPTRGYAFIDYRSNDCVALALSTKEHYVNRRLLVVEERHSPMMGRNARGEHGGGRGARNGGRGRGSGGRDARDGERGERRPPGGRTGRGGIGRGDRSDGPGAKDGGYKARARAEAV